MRSNAQGSPCSKCASRGCTNGRRIRGDQRSRDRESPTPVPVTGPWQVHFTPGWGVSSDVTFEQLIPWNDHGDAGVKYYSGTATYTKTVRSGDLLQSRDCRLELDLGDVQVMARVTLNGQDLGTLWKPPFRVDITDVAKVGDNALEVQVVNLWPNRMIGDEQLPEDSERNPDGTLKAWPQWLTEGQPQSDRPLHLHQLAVVEEGRCAVAVRLVGSRDGAATTLRPAARIA